MSHLPLNYKYYRLFDVDDTYAYIALDYNNDMVSIHFYCLKWTHNIAKAIKDDFNIVISGLKNSGIKKIVASYIDVEDSKWPKFIRMFGFPCPRKIQVSVMEI